MRLSRTSLAVKVSVPLEEPMPRVLQSVCPETLRISGCACKASPLTPRNRETIRIFDDTVLLLHMEVPMQNQKSFFSCRRSNLVQQNPSTALDTAAKYLAEEGARFSQSVL